MGRVARWFWVPPRENENWAQTIVRVLGNLFRDVLTILIVLILLPLGVWGGYILWEATFSQTRLVTATVSHRDTSKLALENGIKLCSEEYPLIVYVENNSSKSLESVTIDLSARERGSTADVLSWDQDSIRLNDIIPPKYAYSNCYRNKIALERSDLVFSGEVSRNSVKLIQPEDWHISETNAYPIKK